MMSSRKSSRLLTSLDMKLNPSRLRSSNSKNIRNIPAHCWYRSRESEKRKTMKLQQSLLGCRQIQFNLFSKGDYLFSNLLGRIRFIDFNNCWIDLKKLFNMNHNFFFIRVNHNPLLGNEIGFSTTRVILRRGFFNIGSVPCYFKAEVKNK